MKERYTKLLGFLLILLLSTAGVYAQSGVGKISGRVLDATTQEPLIGANIVLLNTNSGAATDIEGNYFILNITPGTYSVRFSYVGYASKVVTDVRVVAGITTELNMDLSTDLQLEEIVVTDKRKFYEEKSTNTVQVYDSKQIEKLPVRGVENLASLNAGVVVSEGSGGSSGNATLNVRGGRGGEVLYIVDGVPQNDVYTGANYSQVSNAAIEQLSFQIGGYEAKYGQAQSGIVNVTTKSGDPFYSIYADAQTSTFTDDYGYNLYTANLSGPIIPGNGNHTFFLSGERGWNLDDNPRAIGVEFNSDVKFSSPYKKDASAGVWRYTARTTHRFGDFQVRLGANINTRNTRGYIHSYAKVNSMHNPRNERENLSFSGKISQNLSANAFWNLNLGYRINNFESGDGVWFDQLEKYGDSLANAQIGAFIPSNGGIVSFDQYGIFAKYGRVNNAYQKSKNITMTGDLDFTYQLENHLLEAGGGINYNTLRLFAIGPRALASDNIRSIADVAERYRRMQPTVFGYDITGQTESSSGDEFEPKNPLLAYAYVQDRYELSDMVLNVGLRLDYFDTKASILKDPLLPFGGGTDPNGYDDGDFVEKEAEVYFSPRIGLGFPVTSTTVFHAQYGKFIQQPSLDQLYTTVFDLNFLITDNNWLLNTGHVNSEITTQYEIGFRQTIGDFAALNLTAFYKNTEGLVNTAPIFFQRTPGGQTLTYITPTNTDFGTVKGLALALDITRLSYFSVSVDYTFSIAEGTGSSTNSSFTAAFRNTGGEIPKVIAPLSFDQRHTGVVNIDFMVPKGDLGFLEMLSANVLLRFNSGRPYTPLKMQNLLAGTTNFGETKGYVNSAYGPGNFRIDLRLEKSFAIGNLFITPYVVVENLLDADNPVTVYQSTGDAYTTGWLETREGQSYANSTADAEGFKADYRSLELNPFNFGIPRQIKLGLKVNFSKIEF